MTSASLHLYHYQHTACQTLCRRRPSAVVPYAASPLLSAATTPAFTSLRTFHTTPAPPARQRRPYLLADVGEGITECEIVKWHVQPGAAVQEFDPLCEVQSDKASVEITSRYDGVVRDLAGKVGEIVRVGQPLCFIEMDADGDAEEGGEGQGGEVPPQDGPEGDQVLADKLPDPPAPAAAAAEASPESTPAAPPPVRRPHPLDPNAQQPPPSPSTSVLATPAVRRLGREHSLDLARVPGTGRDGRVTKEDVQRFLVGGGSSQAREAASAQATEGMQPTPHSASAAGEPQPLTGLRKAMFKSLGLSAYIPHFTFSEELDVTALESMRSSINAALAHASASGKPNPLSSLLSSSSDPAQGPGQALTKITLFPLLLKALSLALPSHPLFLSKLSLPPNWHALPLSEQASAARLLGPRASHDVGYALSTPQGLMTPVLRNAEAKSVLAIAREIAAVGERARSGAPLGPEDFATSTGGSTILLSNIGSSGAGTGASPVLPPTGELAIGAVCAVRQQWRPTGSGGKEGPASGEWRSVVPVTFAGDHRVLQGTELAALVREWKWWVENPYAWGAVM